MRNYIASFMFAGLVSMVAPTVWAQGTDLDGEPISERPDGEALPIGAAAETDADVDVGDDVEADADENARFDVAQDESIYIVQRRAYSKKGNFEITPIFYTALNPKFVGYWGTAIQAAYHLRENFSVEFMTSLYNQGFYSALVDDVHTYEDLTPEEVDLKQLRSGMAFPPTFGALSAQFSALYGKLEFYGNLLDYDFYATSGIGWARTVEPCFPGRGGCPSDTDNNAYQTTGRNLQTPEDSSNATKITANLGAGMRIFFAEWLGLRVEVRDIVYSDRKVETTKSGGVGQATTDIRNNVMLFLGASLML